MISKNTALAGLLLIVALASGCGTSRRGDTTAPQSTKQIDIAVRGVPNNSGYSDDAVYTADENGAYSPEIRYDIQEGNLVAKSKNGSENIVVKDFATKAGLAKGRYLAPLTGTRVEDSLFFSDYALRESDGSMYDEKLAKYDLSTETFSRLKTPYRRWIAAPGLPTTMIGFGEPDGQGELRTLYVVDLVKDAEKTIQRLPKELSFTKAFAQRNQPITEQPAWSNNRLYLPVYSALLRAGTCAFNYLPDGVNCLERAPVMHLLLTLPQ